MGCALLAQVWWSQASPHQARSTEMVPNRSWGGAQGTGEGEWEQPTAKPGHSSSSGYHGEVLPSVSDWYSIFRRWNVCFVGLFPWLRGIY